MKPYSGILFCLLLITGACSKKDDEDSSSSSGNNNGGGNSSITIDSPWQYSAKIDGTTHGKIDNGVTIIGSFGGGGYTATPPDSSLSQYASVLMDSSFTIPYFDITRNGHYYLGGQADSADFHHFFTAGSYPFTAEDVNGIAVHWWDESGTEWGTDLGSADQTGSELVIDQVKVDSDQFDYILKVLIHFNCKLYDGNGNSKTLTDGKFVGRFANY
jgi:hypothetical protein